MLLNVLNIFHCSEDHKEDLLHREEVSESDILNLVENNKMMYALCIQ